MCDCEVLPIQPCSETECLEIPNCPDYVVWGKDMKFSAPGLAPISFVTFLNIISARYGPFTIFRSTAEGPTKIRFKKWACSRDYDEFKAEMILKLEGSLEFLECDLVDQVLFDGCNYQTWINAHDCKIWFYYKACCLTDLPEALRDAIRGCDPQMVEDCEGGFKKFRAPYNCVRALFCSTCGE